MIRTQQFLELHRIAVWLQTLRGWSDGSADTGDPDFRGIDRMVRKSQRDYRQRDEELEGSHSPCTEKDLEKVRQLRVDVKSCGDRPLFLADIK